jgi:hypothetical protein
MQYLERRQYQSPAQLLELAGERNVCDVNQQGKKNGYMMSTFSLPNDVKKGGRRGRLHLPWIGRRRKWGDCAGSLWPM